MPTQSVFRKLTAALLFILVIVYMYIGHPLEKMSVGVSNIPMIYNPGALVIGSSAVPNSFAQNTSAEVTQKLAVLDSFAEFQSYVYSRKQMGINNTAKGLSLAEEDSLNKTYIEDIMIMIKSTKSYHANRLQLFIDTWIPQAKESTFVLTDADDENYSKLLGGENYVNTKCHASHARRDLACKMQSMYDQFIKHKNRFRWFCVADDDTYVIVPNLVKILRNYDYNKPWYIGKNSLPRKYKTKDRTKNKNVEYWFATGGAGICFSKAMIEIMFPICGNGEFKKRADDINNPDDTTIGYVCNYLLGVNLTVIPELHSHLEPMWEMHPATFHQQATISWGSVKYDVITMQNRLLIREEFHKFPIEEDPTRMKSVHCYLYPTSRECQEIGTQMAAKGVSAK